MGGHWKCYVLILPALAIVLFWTSGAKGEIPPRPVITVPPSPPIHQPDGVPQPMPDDPKTMLPVFTMDYPRIQIPFEITLWVLLASFAKIGKLTCYLRFTDR